MELPTLMLAIVVIYSLSASPTQGNINISFVPTALEPLSVTCFSRFYNYDSTACAGHLLTQCVTNGTQVRLECPVSECDYINWDIIWDYDYENWDLRIVHFTADLTNDNEIVFDCSGTQERYHSQLIVTGDVKFTLHTINRIMHIIYNYIFMQMYKTLCYPSHQLYK